MASKKYIEISIPGLRIERSDLEEMILEEIRENWRGENIDIISEQLRRELERELMSDEVFRAKVRKVVANDMESRIREFGL